jgi:hypothetical protein
MWRLKMQTSGLVALLLVGMVGCVDLDIENPNAPDAERALSTAGDVESLIGGAYNSWLSTQSYYGPTMMMSNASGQHAAPWSNSGMEQYARIPRIPTNNIAGADNVDRLARGWYRSYRAIAAVRDGLKAIDDGAVTFDPDDETRARAFGRYMQGLAHATVAILYDSGFVYDETSDPDATVLVGAQDVFAAAVQYFADAITLAGGATFTVPATWMSTDVSAATLVQLAYSQRAKFRAAMARTPAERQAVDWAAVVSDVNNGITTDWLHHSDCSSGGSFCEEGLRYSIRPGWSMANNWVLGMADQSGAYQAWINTPTLNKMPFLIITPDTRLPQGADYTAQVANPGAHFGTLNPTSSMWKRDDRGTWRWSYYFHDDPDGIPYFSSQSGSRIADVPQVRVHEMQALVAESDFYGGNLAAVATFVNSTRTTHGLNATDATGTNTSCVPKLPNGSCGNLWEMFKWEKRWEDVWVGPYRIGFYFDSRGWGDLMEGTILQFPVPYGEMQILLAQPYNFGGVGGNFGAPMGTYGY